MMNYDKVYIWGIGHDYQQICNALKWNEDIGSFEILAYISKDFDKNYFDGKDVIRPEQLLFEGEGEEYNYIIVASEQYYDEIVAYGVQNLKIDRKKFLRGGIFKIPCFDWKRYITIYESNISIISEYCYGGILSSKLGLPFCSPFVNVQVGMNKFDYEKLLSRLDYYMGVAPVKNDESIYKDKDWTSLGGQIKYPMLWYDDICLHGFHYKNEEDFLAVWEKRRKRYNPASVFIFKVLFNERDVEDFEKMEVTNKIGFYYKDLDRENIIYFPLEEIIAKYAYKFSAYVNAGVRNGILFSGVNIFKLLLGEKDFKR